jgi:hypothetical protein
VPEKGGYGGFGGVVLVKSRHDSQGSLPKTESNNYLNENSTEL